MMFFLILIFLYVLGSIGYFFYMIFQKSYLHFVTQIVISSGFIIHTVLLFCYGVEYSIFPVNNLHGILSVMAWSIILMFLIIQYKYNLRLLGVYAVPIAAVMVIGAWIVPKTLLHDPKLFRSFWLGTHVFSLFLSDSAFALACGAGFLYIIQENTIKKKNRSGFFFSRLPSLELIDITGYFCVISGFILLTVGLIAGAIYADCVWGQFWSWDPKEICSVIAWFFYIVLICRRVIVGCRGRKFATMAILGFGVLLFTFVGVNFFFKGHHRPFTSV